MKYILSPFVVLLITWTISCSGRPGQGPGLAVNTVSEDRSEEDVQLISVNAPADNSEFRLGSQIKLEISPRRSDQLPDSVVIFFNGIRAGSIKSSPWDFTVASSYNTTTGRKSVRVVAYKNGRARTTVTRFVVILSDIIPKRNGYRIINTFPHDREAFTQGLFYYNGLLYEGTGETNSNLREVELASGRILRQLNLDPSLFGEGITLYKDRIYQITWTSKVGFVYDRSTFRQINKIYYQTQGWGLTTLDEQIVMSDGTNTLYFIEPEMFNVTSRKEVYDNEKKVDQLNELEYINGEIWANIWNTDLIARIDPFSGKVIAYIDLSGILKDPDVDTKENVLNGIAYDRDNSRIFVTGKNWPRLFEIKITE
jgi:glutamine cyclotransferase